MALSLLAHPDEVFHLYRLKKRHDACTSAIQKEGDLGWCYDLLTKTSRSFAMVIQELGPELRDAVCIFYLVLRGLDTVEDDTKVPAARRIELLKEFYKHLEEPGWNNNDAGENENERQLLRGFHHVITVYQSLKPGYR
jgi:farnesyl-diphosphate farnesyltransferase